jgi:hypothetical protein
MPRDTVKETALATVDLNIQLPSAKPEYNSMLANIADKAPAIAQASSNFYKSHSQMMSVTLDVTANSWTDPDPDDPDATVAFDAAAHAQRVWDDLDALNA